MSVRSNTHITISGAPSFFLTANLILPKVDPCKAHTPLICQRGSNHLFGVICIKTFSKREVGPPLDLDLPLLRVCLAIE